MSKSENKSVFASCFITFLLLICLVFISAVLFIEVNNLSDIHLQYQVSEQFQHISISENNMEVKSEDNKADIKLEQETFDTKHKLDKDKSEENLKSSTDFSPESQKQNQIPSPKRSLSNTSEKKEDQEIKKIKTKEEILEQSEEKIIEKKDIKSKPESSEKNNSIKEKESVLIKESNTEINKDKNLPDKKDEAKKSSNGQIKEDKINLKVKSTSDEPKDEIIVVPVESSPTIKKLEESLSTNENKEHIVQLYLEVEELADEILKYDPKNDIIKQFEPHLQETLKNIENNEIAGLSDGLEHVKKILLDLQQKIISEKKNIKPNASPKKAKDDNGKVPVEEIIPDPVYIAPREKTGPKKEQTLWKQISSAEAILKTNPDESLHQLQDLVQKYPTSPDLMYSLAKAYDHKAEITKSNPLLEQAIHYYNAIVVMAKKNKSSVPNDLVKQAGLTCSEKMMFRGFQNKAVTVLTDLIELFPTDIELKNKLGVSYLILHKIPQAKNIFELALSQEPNNGFSKVHYGFALKMEGRDLEKAIKYLKSGIESNAEGTRDARFYLHLGDAYNRLNQTKNAMKVNEEGVRNGLFLNKWQRSIMNVDRLTSRPIWTLEQTTYETFFRNLEKNWQKIKLEGTAALKEKYFKIESEDLTNQGDWRQFELFIRGKKLTENCAKAPVTCSLIEKFPAAAECKRGQVKFSVMEPGTHVWPHTGPTNCRLRAHLGLKIPSNVKMRIADHSVHWKEGKVIVFDDSWEHEVWHSGNSTRLILIVDVWHPELSQNERDTLSAI